MLLLSAAKWSRDVVHQVPVAMEDRAGDPADAQLGVLGDATLNLIRKERNVSRRRRTAGGGGRTAPRPHRCPDAAAARAVLSE
jgi:hypothetical protein